MGAGKGKARRARAAISVTPHTAAQEDTHQTLFHIDKWSEFIANNELQSMRLQEYYLGDGPPSSDATDHIRIFWELFMDAVAVGAIEIPSPYTARQRCV